MREGEGLCALFCGAGVQQLGCWDAQPLHLSVECVRRPCGLAGFVLGYLSCFWCCSLALAAAANGDSAIRRYFLLLLLPLGAVPWEVQFEVERVMHKVSVKGENQSNG